MAEMTGSFPGARVCGSPPQQSAQRSVCMNADMDAGIRSICRSGVMRLLFFRGRDSSLLSVEPRYRREMTEARFSDGPSIRFVTQRFTPSRDGPSPLGTPIFDPPE